MMDERVKPLVPALVQTTTAQTDAALLVRRAREAAALRENLRKRKAQARLRKAGDRGDAPED